MRILLAFTQKEFDKWDSAKKSAWLKEHPNSSFGKGEKGGKSPAPASQPLQTSIPEEPAFKPKPLYKPGPVVYRLDAKKVKDFGKHLNTYHHTKDWSGSGQADENDPVPKGLKKSKGLFAGDMHTVAPYATPRSTKWTRHVDDDGNSVLTFQHKDKARIKAHHPVLSTFPSKKFSYKKGSGEHFSKEPGKPHAQETVQNPIHLMQKAGHKVQFVPNIHHHAKQMDKDGKDYMSEGFETDDHPALLDNE